MTTPRIEHPENCEIKETTEKLRHQLSIILKTLVLILGIATIALGLNEATKDVLDPLGSNYWLAYSAVLSGIVVIVFVLISWKHPKT